MQLEDVQNHLKALSGGGLVLTTEQLARCLSMNPKVISRMRKESRFPIPHKTIGTRKVVYPIGAVVKYLTSDEQGVEAGHTSTQVTEAVPQRKVRTPQKANLPDLSKQMLMRGFLSALKSQQEALQNLVLQVQRRVDYDALQADIPVATPMKPQRRISKV